MAYNPYSNSGGYSSTPEDQFNGAAGEYSPEAILNAIRQMSQQSRQQSGSPFDAILEHSLDFKKANAAGAAPVDPGGQLPFRPGQKPAPLTPPPPAPTDGSYVTSARTQPPVVPTTAAAAPPAPAAPASETPAQTAARWAQAAQSQGHDYSMLLQHPEWITEFRAWQQANDGASVDPVDWLAYAKRGMMPNTLAKRSGQDTMAAWQAAHNGSQATPPPSSALPTGGAAAGGIPGPGAPPTYPTAAGGGNLPPSDDYLRNLDNALRVSQDRELQNSLRQYRSAAGAVGLQNTGAYLPGQGDLIAGLAAQFGQQRAEAMLATSEAERGRAFAGQQGELDRTLKRYGIDVDAYTSRFNTTTNAGVQQAANQMQYDLGMRGIQVNKDQLAEVIRNNTLGYNLGVGQQNLQRYQGDQQSMIQFFQLAQEIGPEAAFARLFGKQAPPTNIPYVP